MDIGKYQDPNPDETIKYDTNDFKDILDAYGVTYEIDGYHLFMGNDPGPDDKVVFISVICSQISQLLWNLLPLFSSEDLSVQIVKNKQMAKFVLNGLLGTQNVGKVIMIFLPADRGFAEIINRIIDLTAQFNGPAVPGKKYLGGLLYTDFDPADSPEIALINTKKLKVFQHKYATLSILKGDIKGDVLKAISIRSLMLKNKFVIKEGKAFMASDEWGRDIRDRLIWQKKVHQDLAGIVTTPHVVDFFEQDGNTYLVMEYIKGKNLRNVIQDTYLNSNWMFLPEYKKKLLLNLLLLVLEISEKIHQKGYVHRDLTPFNLIMTKKKQLCIIDFELTYGINLDYPLPPFDLGTFGYISPEQERVFMPTVQEDIYAIGALMIVLFTNISPVKFDLRNAEQIRKSIYFFTEQPYMADLISRCLSVIPQERPELQEIKAAVLSMRDFHGYTAKGKADFKTASFPDKASVKNIIRSGFEGLTINDVVNNGLIGAGLGLTCPITAILYLIYDAGPAKLSDHTLSFFKGYLEIHMNYFIEEQEDLQVGLFYGLAGKAIALQYGSLSGLLTENVENEIRVRECFNRTAHNLDLAQGIAGQALAAFLVHQTSPSDFYKQKFTEYINLLLTSQKKDGSWPMGLDGRSPVPVGLANGVSGIVFLLIKYDELFPETRTKIAIGKSLSWLTKKMKWKNIKLFFSSKDSDADQSLISGLAGVALVYLYAYKHLKDAKFKAIAEKILWRFSEYTTSIDYSLATGISGLGLVYTKAAAICNNPEWEKRALWIYNVLAHTQQEKENNKISWNTAGSNEFNYRYEGSLFTGSAGILLFLLKFEQTIAIIERQEKLP